MSKFSNLAVREIEVDELDLLFGNEENEEVKEVIEKLQKSGEKIKSTVIIEKDQPKVDIKNQFVIAFTENLDYLAKTLTKTEFRIVFYILDKMEFGNLVSFKQSSISNALGINKSNVSNSFKKLKEKCILVDDEDGNTFFNSNLVIKGLPKKLVKEKRQNLDKAKVKNKDIKNINFE